jgi:Arc/MetJ family transcription regulator
MNTRTNIVIDDQLMQRAMKATGAKSKREAVDIALREISHRARRRNVLELVGKGMIDPAYDVRIARGKSGRGPR